MAPRLRSGKGFTRDEILAHQQALRAGTANTTGLPALPTELLFEIISHFPAIPLPMGKRDHITVYPASYLERPRILRAFSQMCRSFRSIFLPYVWQRIEVCANPRILEKSPIAHTRKSQWSLVSKELATELITQLEIVTIRDPSLAQYVKIVTVLLTHFSADTVVAELVRCLALFPNLHTIQLYSNVWRVGTSVSTAFKGKIFPSVRTVNLNQPFLSTLSSFPEARNVSFIGRYGCSPMVFNECLERCPNLEVLRGFEDVDYRNMPLIPTMVRGFPKTSTMVLDTENASLTLDEMKQLSDFPNLTCIEFSIRANDEVYISGRESKLIRAAENILRDKPGVEGQLKRVVLKFNHTTHQIIIP